ncbi:MAG: acyl-CoA thioesterase [Nonomuraea sp.]|nr:acyl-CoA thioesterase [Nonomuraea sp.]NUP66138.1 acyl-CoA thioesterase [Nonomuraea sp.]NUP78368.1 acyl-CoA thioesterase [Nonomuraea sp.]NUS09624.1 acyl-CoA thioesterase [Nonomuraea sp.]NUT45105.1 acyl-CoA thioesterase [Thermoactinospora sp.]
MGLLHNSRYALLVERAISAYWAERGWSFDPAISKFKDLYLAVREFKITYNAPVMGAGEVLVDFWMDRMGRTSGVYGFRVLSPDRSIVYAEGYRVNVNLDPRTFRPTPFSPELRTAAEPLLAG